MEKRLKWWRLFSILVLVIVIAESVFLISFFPKRDDGKITAPILPATVRGKVLTDLGDMLMANIIVEDSQGKRTLYTTNVLSGYEIQLPEGEYKLHYTRGMQYSTVTRTIKVENFKNYYLEDIRLVKLFDSEKYNFYPGDLHQHTVFSDGSDSVEALARADIAAGLAWALLTDHNENTGISEWLQTNRLPYTIEDGKYKFFTPIAGVEITTGYGHFQSIGSSAIVEEWDIDLDQNENPYEEVAKIIQEIKRNGGIAQLNHPYSTGSMGFNNYQGLWDLVGNFSTIEIWNGYFEPCGYIPPEGVFNQNRQSMLKWFELLNEGLKIFATCGTDLHSSKGSFNPDLYVGESKAYQKLLKLTGQYAGMPTLFVHVPGEFNAESLLNAVKNGNSFLTNGPLIFANVGGKTYGESASVSDSTISLELFCRDGLKTVNVIKNGTQVYSQELDGTNYIGQINLQGMEKGDWIVIEVYGTGVYYGITNPIFFE